MPSGQRVSHYKDYIAGLQPITFHESQRQTLNSSQLNESYATTAITTMNNQQQPNWTLN